MSNKEYRVRLYADENDSYVELWKRLDKKNSFIARYTFGGSWYYVSDPLGYCELDFPIAEDVTIVVCDANGNELFRSRNGDGSASFNTIEQEAKVRWAAFVKANGLTVQPYEEFKEWLLSFQDPEQCGEAAKDYPENWMHYHIEKASVEVLDSYVYLGCEEELQRIHYKHRFCGVEWDEYRVGGSLMGYVFNKEVCGPMYSPGTAKGLVIDAIKANHGNTNAVSWVQHCYGNVYAQRNIWLISAADLLLQGNYRKTYVDRVAAEERDHTRFYAQGHRGIAAIRQKYPECQCDWHFII